MIYEAERGDISIAVVGDAMISRRMREFREPSFLRMVDLLRGADVSLANLEFLFHDYESSWGWSHGTYTRANPKIIDELTWMGFDGFFTANNHSFDFSEGGFLTTLKHLDERGIAHAGGGVDIDHARAPGYIDSARGRVAFMSAASTFLAISRAGPGRADFPGRPGISTLRRNVVHHVPRDAFEQLVKMNRELGFEAQQDAQARFGFIAPPRKIDRSASLKFLDQEFKLSDGFRQEVTIEKDDLDGILRWLRGAKKQADWTVYGLHTHESGESGEFHGGSRTTPPGFMVDFAHRMIDEGLDVFAGAGPHYLRGIEIYKNRPIFYSLGNFIMQNETVDWIPAEAYRNFKLGAEHTPGDYFEDRSDAGKRGFPSDPVFWQALLPVCRFAGGKLAEVKLYPIDLGHGRPIPQRGRPVLAEGEAAQQILEWMRDLSKPLGTTIEIAGDVGTIKLQGPHHG